MAKPLYDNELFYKNYSRLREDPWSANTIEEIPNLYSLLPDLKNIKALDLGCGTGNNCRYFAACGAKSVLGIDISENMINEACRLTSDQTVDYQIMDMERLQLPSVSFDLVTSSLAIHYISNFHNLVTSVFNCLTDNGLFVFSQEHPIYTAPRNYVEWRRDETGVLTGFIIDSYNEPGIRKVNWLEETVIKYHRTLSDIINTLISCGFVIEKIIEPEIPDKYLQYHPEYIRTKHVPDYLMVRSRKVIIH